MINHDSITRIIIEIIIIKMTQCSLCTKRPYLMCHRKSLKLCFSLLINSQLSLYLLPLSLSLSSHSLTKTPSLITLYLPHSLRLSFSFRPSPTLSFSCLTSFSYLQLHRDSRALTLFVPLPLSAIACPLINNLISPFSL
jgi:hypothetical protein